MRECRGVEILEVHVAGHNGGYDRAADVLRAYFEAQRARALRRFLWRAVPVMTLLLVAVQVEDGLIAVSSIAGLIALVCEWLIPKFKPNRFQILKG